MEAVMEGEHHQGPQDIDIVVSSNFPL
jgi:hypothetical protein